MELTADQVTQMLGGNTEPQWCDALNQLLPKYDINTPRRIAMFMAQCGHESANFRFLEENLNYSAEALLTVWPTHFDSSNVDDYARQPEKIANRAYANRMGNGDEASGDGWLFHGRGLIQITGRDNYTKFAGSIGMSLDDAVAYAATDNGAIESACWFWTIHNLNPMSDDNEVTNITKVINGGTLGLLDRIDRYNAAFKILSQ
jgi:putative chitinase